MIFLTVGTVFPFNRLVNAVDQAIANGLITSSVFAQVGDTDLKPDNMEYARMLSKDDFKRNMAESEYLISHAGIGSIVTALELNKRMLVMPRLKRLGEHVNDHQVFTAQRFESLGHVLAAYDVSELSVKLKEIESFKPTPRHADPDGMIRRVSEFLSQIGDAQEPAS